MNGTPAKPILERVSRARVFAIHLGVSLAIFAALAALMVLDWFPGPFFASDGGWQGIRIIALVDVVLGPALTLVFFDPRKKKQPELALDLGLIALVQVVALVWGTWTVYSQRTVAIVFAGQQFYSLAHEVLDEAHGLLRDAGHSPRDVDALSDAHPARLYVRPFPPEQYGQYLADVLNGLPEIQLRSDRYEPLAEHWDAVEEHAVDPVAVAALFPEVRERLAALGPRAEALRFYQLKLRFGQALVGFERDSRELAEILVYSPASQPEAQ